VALTTAWFLSALVALSDAGLDMLAYVVHFYAAVALSAGWIFCLITSRKGLSFAVHFSPLAALPAAAFVVYLLSTIDPHETRSSGFASSPTVQLLGQQPKLRSCHHPLTSNIWLSLASTMLRSMTVRYLHYDRLRSR
jgi:hypothetical protein